MAPVTRSEAQHERGTIGLPRVPSGTQIQFASPSNLVVKPIPPARPQGVFGSVSNREVGIAAAAVVAYFLLFRPTTQAASTTTSTTTPQTQQVPPAPTHLSEPSQLRQIGATATTVIIATDPVAGAIRYDWYSYENNLILARSPSEIAVVNGLNPSTAYEIYVIAVGYGGAQSIPSSPLLVKTLPASPYVLVPTGATTTLSPTQPIAAPTPTFPGLPTATGPSGVTTAPVIRPVQTAPTVAATAVFKLVSAIVEGMPVQPGQYAYANVTVQNIGDAPGGTSISGNTWNPNGNLAGTWSPQSTGVIPVGQTVTITLRSSGLIASPYAIGTSAAPVSRLTATFTAASGGSVSTSLVIALPAQPVQSLLRQAPTTTAAAITPIATPATIAATTAAGQVSAVTSKATPAQIQQAVQPYVNAGFKPVSVSQSNGAVKLAPPSPNQPSVIAVPNTPQNLSIQQKLVLPIGSSGGYPTLAAWTAARNSYLGGLSGSGSTVTQAGRTVSTQPTYTPTAGGMVVGSGSAAMAASRAAALQQVQIS